MFQLLVLSRLIGSIFALSISPCTTFAAEFWCVVLHRFISKTRRDKLCFRCLIFLGWDILLPQWERCFSDRSIVSKWKLGFWDGQHVSFKRLIDSGQNKKCLLWLPAGRDDRISVNLISGQPILRRVGSFSTNKLQLIRSYDCNVREKIDIYFGHFCRMSLIQ